MLPEFQTIRRNYDHLSRWYDLLEGWGERSICLRAIRLLNLHPEDRLLEIGFGTGANMERLGRRFPGSFLAGIDLSFGMCRIAKTKLSHRDLRRIYPLQGNMMMLPFPKASFSAILCCFSLEIIPSQYLMPVMDEIFRVIEPGGQLCVASMADEGKKGIMMSLYRNIQRRWPQVVDCRPIPLAALLTASKFAIKQNRLLSLWGLPVRLMLVQK